MLKSFVCCGVDGISKLGERSEGLQLFLPAFLQHQRLPAQLLAGLLQWKYALIGSGVGIFVYYVLATLFPVDQIIGRVYPLFGGLLLLGTFAIFGKLIFE